MWYLTHSSFISSHFPHLIFSTKTTERWLHWHRYFELKSWNHASGFINLTRLHCEVLQNVCVRCKSINEPVSISASPLNRLQLVICICKKRILIIPVTTNKFLLQFCCNLPQSAGIFKFHVPSALAQIHRMSQCHAGNAYAVSSGLLLLKTLTPLLWPNLESISPFSTCCLCPPRLPTTSDIYCKHIRDSPPISPCIVFGSEE